MIVLVGVGHVFRLKEQIEAVIHDYLPDVVGVELDEERANYLLSRVMSDEKRTTDNQRPILFNILAGFQERAADLYGVQPGDEMVIAMLTAKKLNIKVALLDMSIRELYPRLIKELSYKEKIKLLLSIFASLFITKKRIEKELKIYEQNEEQYIYEFTAQFPTMRRILIDERNAHIANNIKKIAVQFNDIMIFTGDGHISGLMNYLRDFEIKVIRLKDLREYTFPRNIESSSSLCEWKPFVER